MSKPQLSIILVNYKVPDFLEHCLLSIRGASRDIDLEVIVVDNASGDGSVELLSPRFPEVRFLSSEQNLGFAKASNWGYRESTGSYVLFLNPDTLLSEDCLQQSIEFLESRPDAGALGIRMIDGAGRFLPESKRAFPDPVTAFYKIVGLSRLFPRSPRFARYHLGHLSNSSDHAIDVVSGAYFMVRRSVLERVGVFDEQFFMYGEDIDLSYRIQQAGYTNYYFAGSTILHFKGESTQKQSFRYVKLFYGAMSQFVQKHQLHNGVFTVGIQLAIGGRALVSLIRRSIQRIGIPIFDWILILSAFFLVRIGWSAFIRPDVNYPHNLSFPTSLYAMLFFVTGLFAGLFRNPFRWHHFFRATVLSGGVLLTIYSLLPESYRYSRGIVFFGAVFATILLGGWRLLLLRLQLISRSTEKRLSFPVLFIGSDKNRHIVQQLYSDKPAAAFLQVAPEGAADELAHRVDAFHALVRFDDIIFCSTDVSFQTIYKLMERWKRRYAFRFYASNSDAILPLRKEHD